MPAAWAGRDGCWLVAYLTVPCISARPAFEDKAVQAEAWVWGTAGFGCVSDAYSPDMKCPQIAGMRGRKHDR